MPGARMPGAAAVSVPAIERLSAGVLLSFIRLESICRGVYTYAHLEITNKGQFERLKYGLDVLYVRE